MIMVEIEGSVVVVATPAAPPTRVTLEGRFVTLEPLTTAHIDDLYDCVGGEVGTPLWQFMPYGPFPATDEGRKSFVDLITPLSESNDPLFFAAKLKSTGKAVGFMSFMRINNVHRVVEVGGIMFSPFLQRTPAATECMYLMASHIFDTLGYRRYEWKCDSRNKPSQAAALRLGFVKEGVFRNHMIIKGLNRDTAWFSMTDSEWPLRKRALEAWLDPKNFDSEGKQYASLVTLRKELEESQEAK
ncbi:hypothetical protein FQN54_003126 [Arachnomyces sp. PD_36]|nr:hypothetical protein FQN54_003126 [Arachnomyces sp. PD_36]